MLDNEFFIEGRGGNAAPKILGAASGRTAGGVYMAKLGDFMFSLDTAAFQQLERSTGYRWQTLKRIGRTPAAQFLGPDDDMITLAGVIYPHFRGGLGQMGMMRAMAGQGKPMPLIYSFERSGQYCGRWCIQSIREGRTVFLRDGAARKIEFSITLVSYGDDDESNGIVDLLAAPAALATTTIDEPPLLGELGEQVAINDGVIAATPSWQDGIPIETLKNIAGVMKRVADVITDIGYYCEDGLDGMLNGLTSDLIEIMPVEAVLSVREMLSSIRRVRAMNINFDQAADVHQEHPAQLKAEAKTYENDVNTEQAVIVQHAGVVKSAAITLSEMPTSEDIDDIDRFMAAASMRNAALSADQMIFATNETSRQMAAAGEKIIV